MEFCHFVLLSVIFQLSRVNNSANTEELKVRHPQQHISSPSQQWYPISDPALLLHAMQLGDLSAPISSALSFLPAHNTAVTVIQFNSVTAVLSTFLDISLF